MRVSIFGLGYVGCVTAACLAQDKHKVIGIDINPLKMRLLESGQSPVIEPGLDDLIHTVIRSGNLTVSSDTLRAVHESDVSLICVGTPSNDNGSLNTEFVENVCREIGTALASKNSYHVVVVRSTVLPGTVNEKLIPLLEEYSGLCAGVDFGVSMNPEFLREGSAISDYYCPSFIIIGELDPKSGDCVQHLYKNVKAPKNRTSIRVAEMIKYTCNTFHALKVDFANEIGILAKAQGIDGQEVMKIFCEDKQLNISSTYLMPGFAFGGSCLPKDVRALTYRAKILDVDSPLLNAIIPSNQKQIENGIRLIENTGSKRIGILGLSFKADTDDLRESPTIKLVETLLGRGYHIRIYDEKVRLQRLVGANKLFVESEIPHIASLLCSSVEELVSSSDVLVITNGNKVYSQISTMLQPGQKLIDLVGIAKNNIGNNGEYIGICW